MNWAFVAAGCLALIGSAIHGGVGDRIVRRIDEQRLPGNPFAGITTKFLIRVTWHFTTIAFLVLGVALVWLGAASPKGEGRGAAYVAGGAFACWALFGGIAGFRHAGMRVFRSHPAPIVFLLILILIAWGAAQP